MENTGTGDPKLLVATDVAVHWPIYCHMWHLSPDQSSTATSNQPPRTSSDAWHPLAYSKRQLCCWASGIGWTWCSDGCSGLSFQASSLPPGKYDNHSSGICPAVSRQRVKVFQDASYLTADCSSLPNLFRKSISCWNWAGQDYCLSPASGWPNRTGKPRVGAVLTTLCQWKAKRLGQSFVDGRVPV